MAQNDPFPVTVADHVRLRPGMYFGSLDQRGLDAWLGRLLDDSLDEVVAGDCDHIELTFREADEIVVSNNGRGLPVDFAAYPSRSEVKTVADRRLLDYIMVIGSAKRVDGEYRIAQSMFNLALAPINAASEICVVEIKRDGYLWRQEYHQGEPESDLIQLRNLEADEQTGTKIALRPDFTIFERNVFDYAQWVKRFRELACLLPNVTFAVRDERTGQTEEFNFPEGLSAYLMNFNRDRTAVHAPLLGSSKVAITPQNRLTYTITADVAIQFNDTDETAILGYLNTQPLPSGLHMDIALETIRSVINNDWFPWTNLSLEHVKQGLTVVIHVFHPAPHFQGNLRYRLVNADLCGVVVEAISAALTQRQNYKDEIEAKLRANGAPFTNKYKQT